MTNEEFEEKVSNYVMCESFSYNNIDSNDANKAIEKAYRVAYEQGYEDCRHYAHEYYKPKWHDLRENPDDLPPKITWCSESVVNQIGVPCHYNYDKSCWENWSFIEINTPIAWCELPKFTGKTMKLPKNCIFCKHCIATSALEKEVAELKMKLLTLENKEQVVTTTVSN